MQNIRLNLLPRLLVALGLPALASAQIAPQITPNSFGPTLVGTPVTAPLTVTMAAGTCFNWSILGNIPPGMSLSNAVATASATYQGTPSTASPQPYSFEVTAVSTACPGGPQPNPFTVVQPMSHAVTPPPILISPLTAASGTVGVPYSQTFTQTGGYGPGSIAQDGGVIPPGLALTQVNNTAILAGTPTTAGVYTFQLYAFDSQQNFITRNYTVTVASFVPLSFVTAPALPAATAGIPYSVTLQTTGGIPPVSGAPNQNPQLPPGLAIDLATLSISGTPTTAGTFSFTVIARDSQNNTTSRTFTLTVALGFRIITTSLPNGTVSQPYNAQIVTEGSTGPVQFSASGSLPPGLSLNPGNGVVSGIPTAAGRFSFAVTAASGNRTTPPVTYIVTIGQPSLDFTPDVLPNGSVGRAYQSQFSAIGGTGQYRFSPGAGTNLPPGLSLSTSGVISGTPTAEGLFRFVVGLTSGDESIEKLVRITIDPPALAISPDSLPEGMRGVAYQTTFGASGGTSPYSFRISGGQLPSGLTLAPSGLLSGSPTATGSSRFTVEVTDNAKRTGSRDYTLVVREELRITTEILPNGAQGEAYSALVEAAGGLIPYSFSLAAGALPPGVTIASDGRLSGSPTQGGRFTPTVQVTDRNSRTAQRAFVIDILAALRLLPDSLPSGGVGRAYSVSLSAEGGQAPYTLTLTGSLPQGLAFSNGTLSGTPAQPGQFELTGRVTDARGRSASRQYQLTIASPAALTVSGNPGPGTVGTPYQAQFSATGGVAPYSFSAGSAPPGLSLAADGSMTGTPTQAGTFTLLVTATGAFNTQGSASFEIRIGVPAPPTPTLVIANPNVGPAQQTTLTLTMPSPYPVDVTGFLDLTFEPVRGGDDPAIQFSNGSRRIQFTIAANARSAAFTPSPAALQTGTVAGLITLLATMQAGGVDITPSPRPSAQIRIPPGPPVITRVEVSRTATGSDLIVFGYASTREMTQAVLRLTARSGVTLSQTDFTVPLSTVFTTWYTSTQSVQFGSQFRLVIPLSGVNAESVESLTIQLSNPAGNSETARATL